MNDAQIKAVETMREALEAISRARDYFAEHGRYDDADFHPDADQEFDDWAADIAGTAAAAARAVGL